MAGLVLRALVTTEMPVKETRLPDKDSLQLAWKSIDRKLPAVEFRWSTRLKAIGAKVEIAGDQFTVILSVRHFLALPADAFVAILKHEAAHVRSNQLSHSSRRFGYWLRRYNGAVRCPRLPVEIASARLRIIRKEKEVFVCQNSKES